MSSSTARKVQPFTISTRLSLPSVPPTSPGPPAPASPSPPPWDGHRGLRRSINERISLYLAHARAGPAAPAEQPRSPGPGEDGGTDDDRLNRNSLARSIKKITLSNGTGRLARGTRGDPGTLPGSAARGTTTTTTAGQGKLSSRSFSGRMWMQRTSSRSLGIFRPVFSALQWTDVLPIMCCQDPQCRHPRKRVLRARNPLQHQDAVGEAQWSSPPSRPKSSGSPVQPGDASGRGLGARQVAGPKGWLRPPGLEDVAQTLQRDMKDFENSLIKLNQEEKPSLAALLQESPDKIQLTRRILDLKQEEQQFQSLHKEVNSLAQKLEKARQK
ncbi:uncharacterized protein LOC116785059 isoform X2 [Chiroxiphia lanceolata]|uniref:uncharacterized protein LOC116785059 isoform X2 n=1 Tax=Chiroxiphia lanceolata TaxID=296741 RepID=UPI0013CF3EEC|nr:uncharacterized protein LOC116785059 isoform X2 [Chiroxiphia lanceolata]